eukprot:CAMPEP_0119414030 /NCGR_PEP_ID=MMETSP1335-20130426/6400_1 /TAXON_ID=259385 /ORGANISM="Chrysoculter rhomboideus, Strain RCC1486" /LENGTH=225 /DNA_ID=CAMNT_0007438879 /DNA_START=51 /DNA_END=729 /DNA_ORIENTATION=+
MSSRASREQLIGQLRPEVRDSLGANPLVRRILLAHSVQYGTLSDKRGTMCAADNKPESEPQPFKKRRLSDSGRSASVDSDEVSAAHTVHASPPISPTTPLPGAPFAELAPPEASAVPTDEPLTRFREQLVTAARDRVKRCGRKRAIQQVYDLVKRWHAGGLRQVTSSRPAELGVLRAVLAAVLDSPEMERPPLDMEAATALLDFGGQGDSPLDITALADRQIRLD